MSQEALFPEPMRDAVEEAHQILAHAIAEYQPTAVLAMLSGGHDSLCAAHLASRHEAFFTGAVHIHTGIGIRESRRHAYESAKQFGWPFRVYRPRKGNRYHEMVLANGFPGPFSHRFAYIRLKERSIRRMVRDHKQDRHARVMLVTGVRAQESKRRMGSVEPVNVEGARVWVAPIVNWSSADKEAYMAAHAIPINPVTQRLCMSGECLCLAPDTLVSTQRGWQPIAALTTEDSVLNHTEANGVALTPIHAVLENPPAPMLRVKPFYLLPIEATANHPLWVRDYQYALRQDTKPIGTPRWAEVQEVAAAYTSNRDLSSHAHRKHYLGYPFRTEERALGLSHDELRVLGYFMAEGAYIWRNEPGRRGPAGVVFTVSVKSRAMAEDIRDALQGAFGGHVGWREYTDRRSGRQFIMIRKHGQSPVMFLQRHSVGRYCTEKYFAESAMTASLEEQRVIVDAMWRGDGSHFSVDRGERGVEAVSAYGTASRALALQVQELLLRRGEVFGVNQSGNNAYLVRRTTNQETSRGFIERGVLWTGIQRVEVAGTKATYNLTIAGEPNFRTEGGLVHNCGAFASPGELEEIRFWYPRAAAQIDRLAEQARAAGVHAKWGTRPPEKPDPLQLDIMESPSGGLCWSCDAKWGNPLSEEFNDAA